MSTGTRGTHFRDGEYISAARRNNETALNQQLEMVWSPLDTESLRDVVEGALRETRLRFTKTREVKIRRNVAKTVALDRADTSSEAAARFAVDNACGTGLRALEQLCSSARKGNGSVPMRRVEVPPNGLAWVRLHRNMKVPEKYAHDFFVPYLGETDAEFKCSNKLAEVLEPDGSSEEDNSEVEEGLGFDDGAADTEKGPGDAKRKKSETRLTRESSVDASRGGYQDGVKESTAAWDRSIKRMALRMVLEVLQRPLSVPITDVLRKSFRLRTNRQVDAYHNCVQRRLKAWKEKDEEAHSAKRQNDEIMRHALKEETTSASDVLKSRSLPYFICRQCYTFCCVMHGVIEAKPTVVPIDKTRKDFGTKQTGEDIENSCEDKKDGKCWLSNRKDGDCDGSRWAADLMAREGMWGDVKSVLSEVFTTFGDDPCRIASVIRSVLPYCHSDIQFTCYRIGLLNSQLFTKELAETAERSARNRNAMRRGGKKAAKGKTRPPQSESEAMKDGKRIDYFPCHHEGECTKKSCSCVQKGILCEKYCGCNHAPASADRFQLTCNFAFAGCQCKSSAACITNACVCWSQGRECDPDRCRSCCDCTQKYSGQRLSWSCRNVGLRMNYKQRTYVGHSDVHGWGVFAAAEILRGEIVGEYVAEVIKQEHAEERGRVYDETRYSFLFNTTNEYALDSTRLGNKLRYCNHSANPNCEPKVMRVGGDVRVGIYAKRDIAKNEELFFDYGYKKDVPYEWAQHGKESSRKEKALVISAKRAQESSEEEILPVSSKRTALMRRASDSLLNGVSNSGNEDDIEADVRTLSQSDASKESFDGAANDACRPSSTNRHSNWRRLRRASASAFDVRSRTRRGDLTHRRNVSLPESPKLEEARPKRVPDIEKSLCISGRDGHQPAVAERQMPRTSPLQRSDDGRAGNVNARENSRALNSYERLRSVHVGNGSVSEVEASGRRDMQIAKRERVLGKAREGHAALRHASDSEPESDDAALNCEALSRNRPRRGRRRVHHCDSDDDNAQPYQRTPVLSPRDDVKVRGQAQYSEMEHQGGRLLGLKRKLSPEGNVVHSDRLNTNPVGEDRMHMKRPRLSVKSRTMIARPTVRSAPLAEQKQEEVRGGKDSSPRRQNGKLVMSASQQNGKMLVSRNAQHYSSQKHRLRPSARSGGPSTNNSPVPVVSLLSDDEGQSSGSFTPNFHRHLGH